MQTKIFDIEEMNETAAEEIGEAARVLRRGGLVAFPTETVYGLGANALDPTAVAAIYLAKGRPSDNPLIVHVAGVDDCRVLTPRLSPSVTALADRFWPGPLTLVLPKRPEVPHITTSGLATVAIRMPDHPVALELIRQAGCPIAAPSANLSGRPSPTKGDHVVQDMDGRIDVIIRSGDCRFGIESTVLDLSGERPTILRPGILTQSDLEQVLGTKVYIDKGNQEQEIQIAKAPGMKYTHYAPKAEMVVYRGQRDLVEKEIQRVKDQREAEGRKVGLVIFEENSYLDAAHTFFAKLRVMDDLGVDLILATAVNDEDPIGFAVMNRMLKSAGYHVIDL